MQALQAQSRKLAAVLSVIVFATTYLSFAKINASDALSTTIAHRTGSSSCTKEALQSKIANENALVSGLDRWNHLSLACPAIHSTRYDHLKARKDSKLPQYLFALDLYEAEHIISELTAAIADAARYLGPSQCVLSIVEGRSKDQTRFIAEQFVNVSREAGMQAYIQSSDINPKSHGVNRIQALAALRNRALQPILLNPGRFDPDTAVIFINDVSLCGEDILELLHQRSLQSANMVCGMDWNRDGKDFYDVWIGRQMNGDLFFDLRNGRFDHTDLFWNDEEAKSRYARGDVVQVAACWNGVLVFDARPLHDSHIRFRSNRQGECELGEPVHFNQDLWHSGYKRFMVTPMVNVGYTNNETASAKRLHGSVSSWLEKQGNDTSAKLEWKEEGPESVVCVPQTAWQDQTRVPFP